MRRSLRHHGTALLAAGILLGAGFCAHAAIPAAERNVLLELYTGANGAHWNSSLNWNGAAGTECSWFGVACDSGGSTVIGINLSGNNLSGNLPADLGALTNLQFLSLYNNQLTGPIPALTALTKLNFLYLSNNRLSGSIPALDSATGLTTLLLSNNQLTGSAPPLGSLTHLQTVDVGSNLLTGSIPPLTGLTSLLSFTVQNNRLSGSIPSLTGLTSLMTFAAGSNQLTGAMPSFAGLTNLNTVDVSNNLLTGSIPDLTDVKALIFLYVNNNALTGAIPDLSGLPALNSLHANNNQLTGSIPALGGSTSLHIFSVASNQLTGAIPSLAGLTGLTYFGASHNQLSGAIPPLAGLTGLTYLYVRDNQLTGTIPPLTGLTNLSVFDVGTNRLTGSIPSLAGLTGLNRFLLDGNALTGDVPAVPSPNGLVAGGSDLCPNQLNMTADPSWDAATGQTPWYAECGSAPATPNYQGLWWKSDESGWGMNFAHAGDQIFATWYTYDTGGKAWWLSMLASRTGPNANSYGGPILATTGSPFNSVPFPPVTAAPIQVGTGTLTFADANHGSFAYSVNGIAQNKAVTRFDLGTGAQPVCTYSATTPDFALATNYQDLWWVANGAESGWGVNFAHQGNAIFATWYTYDSAGGPLWLSVLATWNGAAYAGPLYRTAGPTFNNYDSSAWSATPVGTATIAFADGNHATFGYVTSGQGSLPVANQSKQLTRFPFAASGGTVCH